MNGVVRGGSYYGDSTNGIRERSGIRVQARKANGQIVVGFRLNGVGKGSRRWTVVIADTVRCGYRGHETRGTVYAALGFRLWVNGGYRVDRGGRAGNTSYSCRGAARDRSSQSGSSVPGFRSVNGVRSGGFHYYADGERGARRVWGSWLWSGYVGFR